MNEVLEKILLIGPRNNKKNPNMASGTIVLFEDIIKQFNLQNINYDVVDTNKNNYKNFLFAYISIIFQILLKQKKCKHIALHSSKDLFIIAPLIIMIGKVLSIKTSLRKFGGDFDYIYDTIYLWYNVIKKIMHSHIL